MKLQFEQVSKKFKDKKVLKDISVTMESGVYGLLGPNEGVLFASDFE